MQYDVPILVIVFNRPMLTQKLYEALKIVKPEYLYIASDSPRALHLDDITNCQATRAIFDNIDWKCTVKKKYNATNLGCDNSIREALDWFFGEVEYGIVLEDDCIPNRSFFDYCKIVLERHKEDNDIALVCGTNHYDGILSEKEDYYMADLMYTWGWASWRRFVKQIQWNTSVTTEEAEGLFKKHYENREFAQFYMNIIQYYNAQPVQTKPWDVDFLMQILKNNLKTLIPTRNMIRNLGYMGTHYVGSKENLFFNTVTYEYTDKKPFTFLPLSEPLKKRLMKSFIKKANSYTFKDKLHLAKEKIKKFLFML